MSKKSIILLASLLLVFFIFVIIFLLREDPVPTHLSAEVFSSSEVHLSWIGDSESSQYNIYRSEEDGLMDRVGFSVEEEYIDDNLKENTVYYYAVTQVINFKESPLSSVVKVQTDPGIPKNLVVRSIPFQKDLSARVELIWDYAIGVDSYVIYRSEERDGLYEEVGKAINEEYLDESVLPGKRYYYAVTQISDGREGDFSGKVGITTDFSWSCGDNIRHGTVVYETLRVGSQCWFKSNLNVMGNEDVLQGCNIERYCYENDATMCNRYGGLYQFESILCEDKELKPQGICPLGWRIPTDDDWGLLEIEMGMNTRDVMSYGFRGSDEGSKLAGGYDLWEDGFLRNSSVFNLSGLDILPGGTQPTMNLKNFRGLGEDVFYWTSTRAVDDEDCRLSGDNIYNIRAFNYDSTRIKRDCVRSSNTAYLRCMRDY